MAPLSMDLDDPTARPYFLWNEDTTVARLREILGDRNDVTRPIYVARILREARYRDVWRFLTLADVLECWDQIRPHLGRQRRFWEYLMDVWRRHGIA